MFLDHGLLRGQRPAAGPEDLRRLHGGVDVAQRFHGAGASGSAAAGEQSCSGNPVTLGPGVSKGSWGYGW